MSDASEVKRWWIEDNEANRYSGFSIACLVNEMPSSRAKIQEYIVAEDHDRIMSERDELWKRATKFVMPGEMDTGESIEHYIKTLEQTIATQAKVIEKLKTQRSILVSFAHCGDILTDETLERMNQELAAVEKEGAKDEE